MDSGAPGKAVISSGNTGPRDFSAQVGSHFGRPSAPDASVPGQDIDSKAAVFAAQFGSFSLHFDAAENYGGREPCPLPWALELESEPGRAWGGHTAVGALDSAAAELAARSPS